MPTPLRCAIRSAPAPDRKSADGGSSNGRTADSDSASLGSNPSPPATQNPSIPPALAFRKSWKPRNFRRPLPHKSGHSGHNAPRTKEERRKAPVCFGSEPRARLLSAHFGAARGRPLTGMSVQEWAQNRAQSEGTQARTSRPITIAKLRSSIAPACRVSGPIGVRVLKPLRAGSLAIVMSARRAGWRSTIFPARAPQHRPQGRAGPCKRGGSGLRRPHRRSPIPAVSGGRLSRRGSAVHAIQRRPPCG